MILIQSYCNAYIEHPCASLGINARTTLKRIAYMKTFKRRHLYFSRSYYVSALNEMHSETSAAESVGVQQKSMLCGQMVPMHDRTGHFAK